MTPADMQHIVDQISFPKMRIDVRSKNEVPYLQIAHRGECNMTGVPMEWRSRKWMLSEHMTAGEIVQTAFKAILTAIEHEAREQFRYRGQPVFDPHYNIEKLVALRMDPKSIEERATV